MQRESKEGRELLLIFNDRSEQRIRKKGTRDFLKRNFHFFFYSKEGLRENNLKETKIKIAYQIGEDVQKADPTQEVLFCL